MDLFQVSTNALSSAIAIMSHYWWCEYRISGRNQGANLAGDSRSCHIGSWFVNIFCEIHLFHWLMWLRRPCAVPMRYAIPVVCHNLSAFHLPRSKNCFVSLVNLLVCQLLPASWLGDSRSCVPLGCTCLTVRGWQLFLLHAIFPPLRPAPRNEEGTAPAACVTSRMLPNRAAMWLLGSI